MNEIDRERIEKVLNKADRAISGQAEPEVMATAITLLQGEDIEVQGYFEEAKKLLGYAESRVIATTEDAKVATDDLSIIARLEKAMLEKRKEKLEPSKLEAEAIRATYDFLMAPVLEAKRITKEKQTAFLLEQKLRQETQEGINRKRIEAAQEEMRLTGELSESVDLVEVVEAPKRLRGALGTTGLTDCWKYEVTDFALLPDEYKVADSVMLNAVAKKHHDQKLILGVRFYNDPYVATRLRG